MSISIGARNATTQYLSAGGVSYAYRTLGTAVGTPLVLFQRFRGTIDDWDPELLDALSAHRRVVIFDSAGVGLSSGEVPASIAGVAERAADFITALGLDRVDVLGWSMGGAVAQQLALTRPGMVRRLVLAGTGPGGVPEAPRMPERVLEVMQKPVNDDEDFLYLFFHTSPSSLAAGWASLSRLRERSEPAAPRVKPESVRAQLMGLGAWAAGKGSAYPRLGEIVQPTLVANGAHDVMIHPISSYVMSQRIPNATLLLLPDSGHGFLFQHAIKFARAVTAFLGEQEGDPPASAAPSMPRDTARSLS